MALSILSMVVHRVRVLEGRIRRTILGSMMDEARGHLLGDPAPVCNHVTPLFTVLHIVQECRPLNDEEWET
jgi:hypothetical protein